MYVCIMYAFNSTLQVFCLYIVVSLILYVCFYGVSVSVNVSLPLHVFLLLFLFFSFSSSCVYFIIFGYVCLYFNFHHIVFFFFFNAYIFSNERERKDNNLGLWEVGRILKVLGEKKP